MQAFYHDGSSSLAHPVQVHREGDRIRIAGKDVELEYRIEEIRVPSRLGDTARSLLLPDGGELHGLDNDTIDRVFPQDGSLERLVHRLEQYWPAALASIVVIALGSVAFLTLLVPWIGDQAAQRLPVEAEQLLGRQVPLILEQLGMRETQLPAETRERLSAEFAMLTEGLTGADHYRLQFAHWSGVPNALALPGGTVVITDELVDLLEEDRLVIAVMAHEIGHLEHRHLLRSVAQSASVFVVLGMALSDVSALSVLGAGLPAFLINSHFSREFEREADSYAFELLLACGRSPLDFADAMSRLAGDVESDDFETRLHYLSTHPASTERIEAAREAAERAYFSPVISPLEIRSATKGLCRSSSTLAVHTRNESLPDDGLQIKRKINEQMSMGCIRKEVDDSIYHQSLKATRHDRDCSSAR